MLGLGFGMGPLKFMRTLQANAKLVALFDNEDLSSSICVGIVRSFWAITPAFRNSGMHLRWVLGM